MAARTRKIRHDDDTRARIQTTQLVNRLQDNALGKLKNEMTPGQVRSAEILLKKKLPDLSAAENKTEVVHRYVARLPQKAPDAKAWQQQQAPTSH
jgi:hypothetical protein